MKNRYINHSHIQEQKFREVVKLFCEDLTAQQIANLTNLNRNTINRYLTLFRTRIEENYSGELRINPTPFMALTQNRKRLTNNTTIIFGIIKEGDKIYTEIIPQSISSIFQDIIKGKINPNDIDEFKKWCPYHSIANIKHNRYCRMRDGNSDLIKNNTYIDNIESFWGYTKIRLNKFHGINKNNFIFHLKECEFRFNNKKNNIHKLLLKNFRKNPLG